jgi:hypothetical protein
VGLYADFAADEILIEPRSIRIGFYLRWNQRHLRAIFSAATAGPSDCNVDERQFLDWSLDLATANTLGADAGPLGRAFDLHLDPLEIRLEDPLVDPGDLLTDPAQVFGLAAVSLLVADDGLLPAHCALHTHS